MYEQVLIIDHADVIAMQVSDILSYHIFNFQLLFPKVL